MKNIGISLGMCLLVASILVSCGKKEENTTETTTETIIEKTVIVDTVTVKAPENPDGTSVKVGSDGVEFNTKDGTKSTSIEIKK